MRTKINKRLLIPLLLFLAIGAYFLANVVMPDWAYLVSAFSILLFLIPAFIASISWLGLRDTSILFVLLGVYAFSVESIAIITGFPYGEFSYSDLLGFKLFGLVPWTVLFAWTPLLLAAYSAVRNLTDKTLPGILGIALLLVAFDLVLDPGAVSVGFWTFSGGGWFYSVPISNFLGWIVSGAIGAILLELAVLWFRPLLPVPVKLMESGILVVFFWTCVALFSSMYIPSFLGFAILFALAGIYSRFYYPFDGMVVLVDEQNVPVGTALKEKIHTDRTPLHRAFSIFIFNSKGELLLQQRAAHKKTWGGVWSNSCCGHVMLHEPVEKAARRRLKYELGMTGIELTVILPDYRYRAEKDGVVENEFCPVLIGFTDIDPKINPEEVSAFEWVAWSDFLKEAADPDTEFSPWAVEEAQLLSENPQFIGLYQSG